jgi:uncharacterized protein YggE
MRKNYLPIFIFILAVCFSTNAQNISQMPAVDVTGTSEIKVVPDEVTFALRISKSDKSLQTAKAQNDANISKIIELVKGFGIPAQNIKTDFISVREKYDRIRQKGDDEYTEVFAGYTVSKTVMVKLQDISKFENLFSEIIKIGVTAVNSVSFQSSQLRKHKDQARAMAMKAAKEKATALAAEIGQTIGKAVSIEEENEERSSYANSSSNSNSISYSTESESADNDATFSAGTITVKALVKVSFLLN